MSQYQRNKEQPMQRAVEDALALYRGDVNQVGAGYNILRYAVDGLIRIMPEYRVNEEFLDWYPRNQSYTILRLALAGKLSYKQQ